MTHRTFLQSHPALGEKITNEISFSPIALHFPYNRIMNVLTVHNCIMVVSKPVLET